MWFKNLTLWRLPRGFAPPPAELERQLAGRPLAPCKGLAMQSLGWVAPGEEAGLVHAQGKQLLFALGIEDKLLPAAVIGQAVREKAASLEARQGFKPGRKQLRELKDQVTAELLPRAFVRRRVVRAWADPVHHWIAVDAASIARAEQVIETLRHSLGEFPATLPQTAESPTAAMSAWLAAGDAPGNFGIDQDCELSGGGAGKPVVRYVRHAPDAAQARSHLAGGKTVTRLGLTWKERLSFVLTEQLQVKRLRFLEMEKSRADDTAASAQERLDADFALMSGEVAQLLAELMKALGGAKAA